MSGGNARKFFGRALRDGKIDAAALLPSVVRCEALGTPDPQAYLRKAAMALAESRGADAPVSHDERR
jgi:hypothetical protein